MIYMIPAEIITTIASALAGYVISYIANKMNHKKEVQKILLKNVYAPLKFIIDFHPLNEDNKETIKQNIIDIIKPNYELIPDELQLSISKFLNYDDINEFPNADFINLVYRGFYYYQAKLNYDEGDMTNKFQIQNIFNLYFRIEMAISFIFLIFLICYIIYKFDKLWLYSAGIIYCLTIPIGITIFYLRNKEIKKKLIR